MLVPLDGKKITLLLVDDEPDLLELFTEYASSLSPAITIKRATNGLAALEIVKNETIDIVLTDLRMPLMGGMDLIKNLRQLNFWNPVIVLTGHGEKKTVVEALRLGVFEFLDKPIEEPVFIETIGKVVAFAEKANTIIAQAPPSLRQSLYYMELLKARAGA